MTGKNLLVATDGSANADRAVAYAISLVRRGVATRLHLLNVQPPLEGVVGNLIDQETVDAYRRKEGAKMLVSAEAMCAAASVESESHVDAGRPGVVVTERADQLGCDSIVVGTRGHTGLKEVLLGSVARDVVSRVKVPVWLVK